MMTVLHQSSRVAHSEKACLDFFPPRLLDVPPPFQVGYPSCPSAVLADTRLETDVKVERSDNGSDSNVEFSLILGRHEIEREYIPLGVSRLNRVVERAIAILSATRQHKI